MTIEGEREEAHAELAKERWQAHRELHAAEKELDHEKWHSHDELHDALAHSLSEYKRDSNEWRGSLADLRANFATRLELEAIDKRLGQEREDRLTQVNLTAGVRQGVSQTTAIILGALGAAATIIGILAVLPSILAP